MKERIVVYWPRRDFRLHDNPALTAAVHFAHKEGSAFLPLFILERYMTQAVAKEQFGYPSRLFLARALPHFASHFPLFAITKGTIVRTFTTLAQHASIEVFVNEDIHPDFYAQLQKLREAGISIKLFSDTLTVSKETKTGSGTIYSIFTPFKRAVWDSFCSAKVLPLPRNISTLRQPIHPLKTYGLSLCDTTTEALWNCFSHTRTLLCGKHTFDIDTLLPTPSSYDMWYTSEEKALEHLHHFLQHAIDDYATKRDSLALKGTSTISIALAWGLISARTIHAHIQQRYGDTTSTAILPEGPHHFISELIWREFYHYLLFHYPSLLSKEFQQKYQNTIAWEHGEEAIQHFIHWMQGTTGYPIVDAAMRELIQTGYMHNRARMIVASVLTKHFGIDWRWGQEYFRAMLIDLDEGSNNGGWQWAASVGADPKPIRIFNPYLQASRYDPENVYQNTYLPESYKNNPPAPRIEHAIARAKALARYGLQREAPTRDY